MALWWSDKATFTKPSALSRDLRSSIISSKAPLRTPLNLLGSVDNHRVAMSMAQRCQLAA